MSARGDDPWAKLEQAVEVYLQEIDQPGLLLDWVLVTHQVSANDDGSNEAMTTYTGAEHQTQYRTLGLLEYGAAVVKAEIDDALRGDGD